MRPAVVLALALFAAVAAAQTVPPAEDAEAVRATVVRLFDGMRAKDTTAVRSAFHPSGRLQTLASRDAGTTVEQTTLPAFLSAIAGAPVTLDERVGTIDVRVDDALATAWMPYRFYAGDRFSHCGVNAMTLARTAAGWQIVHVLDTRRRACE